jgi:hypothetical protein
VKDPQPAKHSKDLSGLRVHLRSLQKASVDQGRFESRTRESVSEMMVRKASDGDAPSKELTLLRPCAGRLAFCELHLISAVLYEACETL